MLGVSEGPGISSLVIKAGLGYGALGTIVFILGWALPGKLDTKLTALFILLGVFTVYTLMSFLRGPSAPISVSIPKLSKTELGLIVGSAVGMLFAFTACFSPITYYDSLVYHLALPQNYLIDGKIAGVPYNLYSAFPSLNEMVFLFVLRQSSAAEYVINLLGFSISVGVAVCMASLAREWGSRREALLAFFLWWTMPTVLLLSLGAYIDVPLAAWTFMALYALRHAIKSQWNPQWLLISGLFAGMAFASKYTGAVCPILISLYLIVALREAKFRSLVAFAIGVAMVSIWWPLKNLLELGNPFFPFFYNRLGENAGWTKETAAAYFGVLTEYGAKSRLFFELISSPLHIATNASKFGGGFDVLGDFGWPLFLIGCPLALFSRKKPAGLSFFGGYFVLSFVIWFMTKPVLRFLIPILPVAALLSAHGFENLMTDANKWIRRSVVLFLAPWLLSNVFLYNLIASELQLFNVAMGKETKQEHLERRLGFYPMFDHINKTLSKNDRVFIVGEQRTYHLQIPYLTSNIFSASPVAGLCNTDASGNAAMGFFNDRKVTHVLISWPEIERLGGIGKFGFSDEGIREFMTLLSRTSDLVFEANGLRLYRFRTGDTITP